MEGKGRRGRLVLIGLIVLCAAALAVYLSSGLAAYQADTTNCPVRINELISSNGAYPDGLGGTADWIELYNRSAQAVDLTGFLLTDNDRKVRYTFPAHAEIAGNGYLVIYCEKDGGAPYADFSIAKGGGETILLLNRRGNPVDGVATEPLKTDQAMAYDGTEWTLSDAATPGFSNDASGRRQYLASLRFGATTVRINEMQSRNDAIPDSNNRFCDWIELYNDGDTAADLSGFRLTDRAAKKGYVFPEGSALEAGAYLVIHCMSDPPDAGYAPFALSGDGGESVLLEDASGIVLDKADTLPMNKNASMALDGDGVWRVTDRPTPGYENSDEGYAAYMAEHASATPLVFYEVMPGNATLLKQANDVCYDWIELKNISDAPIRLSDYRLSDSERELARCQLPDVVLASGELAVFLCTGNETVPNASHETLPLTLRATGETLYLSDGSGTVLDSLSMQGIPYGASYGRMADQTGLFYFSSPGPGRENSGGYRAVSAIPTADRPGGVYGGDQLTVQLSGAGTIRYTLDGSAPMADSPRYEAPIVLTKTAVVRAVSMEAGKYASPILTETYLLHTAHDLPIVCLTVDPADLNGADGILASHNRYDHNAERCAHVEYFEQGGGFSLDCGLKLQGRMSRQKSKGGKFSYKLLFRGRYGTELLEYPLFENTDATTFGALLIRNGSDLSKSALRDEFLTRIACRTTEQLCVMDSRFCVLYINGSYTGLYALKEALSKDYYAVHFGVSADSVETYEENVEPNERFEALMQYAVEHDLRDEESYRYIAERVDLESVIDWCIYEAYAANGDVQVNVRCYRSSEGDGKWRYALYDLDMGMCRNATFLHLFHGAWNILPRALLRNETYQDLFLTRLAWHLENDLSQESVLSEVDALTASIRSEMPRERARWRKTDDWETYLDRLRFEIMRDRAGNLKKEIAEYMNISDAVVESYFTQSTPKAE